MIGSIEVSNLGKAYKQYPNRWARLAEWALPFGGVRHRLQWVLQNITFRVDPGEAVGIIGINGAGKSTLLKLVTGTVQPTTGHVAMTGRIAAMLELGMGFHPDFTGRQNVMMAGQLLGLHVSEIAALMPDIEAFAEIGDYIDRPLRIYSSGMQMRLAFSVATARRPDVLVIDEILSVGDAYFQHKSFDRIREFRKKGTTLLIVSHDKGTIQAICDRAILLNDGHLAMAGEPGTVMDYYNAILAERGNETVHQQAIHSGKVQTVSGSGKARIADISLLNEKDECIEVVNVGQPVKLKLVVEATTAIPELVVGYMIKDRLGQPMFGTNTHHLKRKLMGVSAGSVITFVFGFLANMGPGTYSISVALHTGETHITNNYEWRDLATIFNVINIDKDIFVGAIWLPPTMECHR